MLMVLSANTHSLQDSYWVLGIYANKTNAVIEQRRLTGLLEVWVKRYEENNLYRLVVLRSSVSRDTLNANHLDAWPTLIEAETIEQPAKDEATPQASKTSSTTSKH